MVISQLTPTERTVVLRYLRVSEARADLIGSAASASPWSDLKCKFMGVIRLQRILQLRRGTAGFLQYAETEVLFVNGKHRGSARTRSHACRWTRKLTQVSQQ